MKYHLGTDEESAAVRKRARQAGARAKKSYLTDEEFDEHLVNAKKRENARNARRRREKDKQKREEREKLAQYLRPDKLKRRNAGTERRTVSVYEDETTRSTASGRGTRHGRHVDSTPGESSVSRLTSTGRAHVCLGQTKRKPYKMQTYSYIPPAFVHHGLGHKINYLMVLLRFCRTQGLRRR